MVKISDSRPREATFEASCSSLEMWAISFTQRCYSSLSRMKEYLTIGSGGIPVVEV